MPDNALYYGDNLYILRKYIKAETVDLVYIDPPFNSNADYNILFKERDGTQAASQIKAFTDTWHWDVNADRTYRELIKRADPIAQAMYAFYRMLGTSDMLAYLAMMAARLVELHRVLKPTGSLYLHCDPTAGHYLKILLDALFGPTCFRNEIVWKRTQAHNDPKRCGNIHDLMLYYVKDSRRAVWYGGGHTVSEDYLKSHYASVDAQGRHYQLVVCHAPGPGPARTFFGQEMEPAPGRHWTWTQENIDRLTAEGRIVLTRTGRPRLVQFAPQSVPLQDVWVDIDPLNSRAAERLGYPTQKPLALLERIIRASTKEGDIVLDAFCGCGTAVAAAQKLKRPWIGIDITQRAIEVIRDRLDRDFGAGTAPEAIGQPQTLEDAQQLAKDSPYAFEDWALDLVGAHQPAKKKGADKGIDGRRIIGLSADGKPLEMLVSVKSGRVSSPHVRDLRGTVEREGAAIGLFITLQDPTKAMKDEALAAGMCELPGYTDDCPRMQMLTIVDLFAGELPRLPTPFPVASPTPKPPPTTVAPVMPFQRPLPGAAARRGAAPVQSC